MKRNGPSRRRETGGKDEEEEDFNGGTKEERGGAIPTKERGGESLTGVQPQMRRTCLISAAPWAGKEGAQCASGMGGDRTHPAPPLQRARTPSIALCQLRASEVITPTLWDAQDRDIDTAIADF